MHHQQQDSGLVVASTQSAVPVPRAGGKPGTGARALAPATSAAAILAAQAPEPPGG